MVQLNVWTGTKWVNIFDGNDFKNTRADLHQVAKVVETHTSEIQDATKTASDAVKAVDSAVSASKVNSDAIAAQSSAISEAKIALDSATAEIQQTASNAASDAANIRADVATANETLTGQGKQIATINTTLDGLNTKYEGVSDDLSKLSGTVATNSTQIGQNKNSIALKADQSTVDNLSGEVSQNTAQLKVQAGQISSKVSSEDFSALSDKAMQNRGTVSGPDFNTLTQAGYYTVTNTSGGENYPIGNGGTLEVSGQAVDGNGRLNQKYVGDNDSGTYTRQYNAGTKVWTAWIKDANQNDIDTLNGMISKNSTAIEQNKNQISLKADQTEVDSVKNTAKNNSSRLDVMDNEIQSKVTSTDVNNIVDSKGYTTTSSVQSMITQSAGSINETITNLTNRFNSLQVGGRNLLTNTDKDISVTSHTTDGWPAWANIDTGFSFEHGKTYTFSTEAKNSTDKIAEASIRVFEASTNTQVGIYAFPADGNRHSVTFTIPNDTHDYHLLFYAGHAGIVPGVDVTTTYHHPKLELGTMATDWSPAPEDMATVTQVQQITATVDGLQSTVANKADELQVTQLSNLVQSKVSSSDFNSKITQLANDINLRVKSGDLLSQINIAAGHTLIQSDKIYLDADSVVFGENSKAFIPSAYITDINADKITTGILNSIAINNGDGAFTVNAKGDVVANSIKVRNGNFYQGDIFGANIYAIMRDKDQRAFSSLDDVDETQDNWFKINGDILEWHRAPDEYASIGPSLGYMKDDETSTGYTHGLTIVGTEGITLSTGNRAKWAQDNPEVGTYKDPIKNIQNLSWANETRLEICQDRIQVNLGDGGDLSDGSIFNIQKDDYLTVEFGAGSKKNEIQFTTQGRQGFHSLNDGVIYFDRNEHGATHDGLNNFLVFGNLNVTQGQKNSLVKTSQGWAAVHAYETAEYYFGDIGENNTGANGKVIVGLDQLFAQTINTDMQYQVFITPYNNAHVWVSQRLNNRFVVESDQPNAEFGWEIKGHRKEYEHSRLTNFSQSMN